MAVSPAPELSPPPPAPVAPAPARLAPAPDQAHELLQQILADDHDAWRLLVARFNPFLLAAVRRAFAGYAFQPREEDVDDTVAEVWKNLLENDRRILRGCVERRNFPQTLQVLARNRSVDLMRRRRLPTQPLDACSDPPAAPAPAAPDWDPRLVAAAVDRLPPREQMLVRLFFLQGRKYREIAGLTGIPLNSIGPTLARALARLRAHLGPPA